MPRQSRLPFVLVLALLVTLAAGQAQAQNVTVTAADPPSGEQDTLALVVKITGKNFAPGARADFFKSKTSDPAGITVRSTQYVSATELRATIDIAPDATVSTFDIKVTLQSGRSGKGSDLFSVVQKNSGSVACDSGTYMVPSTPIMLNTVPESTCYVGISGTLDCNFGTEGLITTAVRPPYGVGVDLASQSDGKLLALVRGYTPSSSSGTDFYVVRYEVNGAVDSSYGVSGIVHVEFTAAIDAESPSSIVVQPDGKVLVAGSAESKKPYGAKGVLARLLPDGSLDPSFGTGGKAYFSFASDRAGSSVSDIQVQRDGRVVVAGETTDRFAVARFTPAGVLDTSFGNGGRTVFQVGQQDATFTQVGGVAFQEWNGEEYPIVAGNSPTCPAGVSRMAIVRLLPNGSIDSTFGPVGTGMAFIAFRAGDPPAVAVDPSNHIVVVGGDNGVIAAARLDPGGTMDPTFGTAGGTRLTLGSTDGRFANRVQLDPVGRIVFSGYAGFQGGPRWFVVGRLLPNGSPDFAFGGVGAALADFEGDYTFCAGLAIQPGGRIVASGRVEPSLLGLAGYTP